jgi:AcrR family transcriptional regulator
VARWEPGAQERLCRAALDLYLERGFDDVTVAEITERAGLTRRTFFRYFTDKREVLFGGAAQLPSFVTATVRQVDEGPAPFEVVLAALRSVGAVIVEHATRTRERRRVIAASPELQERERTKQAAITEAVAEGLRGRGVAGPTATLLAGVGVAILCAAIERWADGDGVPFDTCFDEAVGEVTAGCAAAS